MNSEAVLRQMEIQQETSSMDMEMEEKEGEVMIETCSCCGMYRLAKRQCNYCNLFTKKGE